MRFPLGWRRVLSAWVLVLLLILAGFGAASLAPSLHVARAGPELQGARIPQFRGGPESRAAKAPQFDPFDLGPPAFDEPGSADDSDLDAEARFTK
jgi:hypothetical protein